MTKTPSRRAWVWIFILLFGGFFFQWSSGYSGGKIIRRVISPTWDFAFAFERGIRDWVLVHKQVIGYQRENELLRKHIGLLEAEKSYWENIERQNKRLIQTFNMPKKEMGDFQMRSVMYKTIGMSNASLFVRISKDEIPNKYHEIPVLYQGNLLGKGAPLGDSKGFVEVQTIFDKWFSAPVTSEEGNWRGMIYGVGDVDKVKIELLEGDRLPEIGEQVFTSGEAGYFPKGISVGEVERIEKNDSDSDIVWVKVLWDIQRVQEVVFWLPPVN